jgi:RimJ/RimL family protein N-acetyltransferase
MRTWIPSHAFLDQAHAASVLEYVIKQYDTGADLRSVPIVFAVQLKANGELVGHAGLTPSEEGVEVTFAIERAQQGKGLATEAVTALCAWATKVYPINGIYGITAKQNFAAQHVLLRAGFVKQREHKTHSERAAQAVIVFEYSKTMNSHK